MAAGEMRPPEPHRSMFPRPATTNKSFVDAIQTFRLLPKYGEADDANDVRPGAVNSDWIAKGDDELRQVAQAVVERRRLKLTGP